MKVNTDSDDVHVSNNLTKFIPSNYCCLPQNCCIDS